MNDRELAIETLRSLAAEMEANCELQRRLNASVLDDSIGYGGWWFFWLVLAGGVGGAWLWSNGGWIW